MKRPSNKSASSRKSSLKVRTAIKCGGADAMNNPLYKSAGEATNPLFKD